jgi:LysM domain-containing protein
MSALSAIETAFDQVTPASKRKAGRPGLRLVTGRIQSTAAPLREQVNSTEGIAAGPAPRCSATQATRSPASPGVRSASGQDVRNASGHRVQTGAGQGTRPLPGQSARPLPGQSARSFAGQSARPLPGESARSFAGQSARPVAGHGLRASAGRDAKDREHRQAQSAAPLRLTHRGRLVVCAFAVLLATVVITVLGVALSGRAQASNHGRDGAGYQGMHQIVVRSGETLWAIASQAEPTADPRQVIAEIMAANSMTSSGVQAGELLWVPK